MTAVLLVLAWWFVGTGSFIFWWIKFQDLSVADLLAGSLIGGLFGPCTFVFAWLICGGRKKVLLRKRGEK